MFLKKKRPFRDFQGYCSYRSPQYFGNGYEMSGYRLKHFPFSCATFELAYQLAFFTSKIFSKQYPTMAIKYSEAASMPKLAKKLTIAPTYMY